MTLLNLLFPQPSPNRCKKVTKNKIKNNHDDDNFGFIQINTYMPILWMKYTEMSEVWWLRKMQMSTNNNDNFLVYVLEIFVESLFFFLISHNNF